jgi:hypothetical protein
MIKLTNLLNEESFTAVNKATGKTSIFKSKDSRDAAVKAGTHDKKEDDGEKEQPKGDKPNMFSKDAGYDSPDTKSSEPKSQSMDDLLDKYDGSWASGVMVSDLVKGNLSAEDLVKVAKHHDIPLTSDDVQKQLDDSDNAKKYAYQNKVSEKEVISRLEKLRDTLKDKEKPKSEPTKDSTQQRAGNPEVNKKVRATAKKLGITPAKLGKDEYKLKMSQAAVEALTDANFHSEARALISKLEGKPEWAEKPTDMPDISSPEYGEWRKNSVYSSKYYDADDSVMDLGTTASQEAGWDGRDALDSIAFDLKMNGFKNLAATLQSVIKESKSTKLTDLI